MNQVLHVFRIDMYFANILLLFKEYLYFGAPFMAATARTNDILPIQQLEEYPRKNTIQNNYTSPPPTTQPTEKLSPPRKLDQLMKGFLCKGLLANVLENSSGRIYFKTLCQVIFSQGNLLLPGCPPDDIFHYLKNNVFEQHFKELVLE